MDGDGLTLDGTRITLCPWWDGERSRAELQAQLEREAPILGTTLRVREEIDARVLRSLASLHGDDPEAWRTVIEWGREHPGTYEGLPD